jgi:hypothetical protein
MCAAGNLLFVSPLLPVERFLHNGGDIRQASFETVGFANLLRMKLLYIQ